jgi:tRNA (guanine37-N1)-methyltransferase
MGDFVLCAGDIPAMALIEGCIRLVPGVVHSPESVCYESFQEPLLEHPQYTRPSVWKERHVPPVLLSGNHAHIAQWKKESALEDTAIRRPDLLSPDVLPPDVLPPS